MDQPTSHPQVLFFHGLNTYEDGHMHFGPFNHGPMHAPLHKAFSERDCRFYPFLGLGCVDPKIQADRAIAKLQSEDFWRDGHAVHLIGHSMGGLVARAFASHPQAAGRVLSVTTIGTPHQGTLLAEYARDFHQRERLGYLLLRSLGYDTATRARMYSLVTSDACATLNAEVKDVPGLRYQYPVCEAHGRELSWMFKPLYNRIHRPGETQSDGWILTSSQSWGQCVGSFALDHFAQLGYFFQFGTKARNEARTEFLKMVDVIRGSFATLLAGVVLAGLMTMLDPSRAEAANSADPFGPQDTQEVVNENPLSATGKLIPSKLAPGGTTELLVHLELAEGHHAYLDKFKLQPMAPDGLRADQLKISPTVKFKDVVSGKMKDGIEGKAVLKTVIEASPGMETGSFQGEFALTYQACTAKHCLFPKTINVHIPVEISSDAGPSLPTTRLAEKSTQGPAATATSTNTRGFMSGPADFSQALGRGTVYALMFVFAIGFLTSLTPCIYPMIPITVAVLGTRTKGQSKLKSFSLSFVYVLGMALTYSVLGVVAASTGSMFGALLGNVAVVTVIAAIFVAMGLSMYGVFELQAPAFISRRIGGKKTDSGFPGAFLSGIIAGVVAGPCVGPVLVGVLTYIAQTQNQTLGFFLLFTFALGMGVLFLILGTSSALLHRLPKAGPWMEGVKFFFGTVMIGMAFYYVKPLYPTWLFQALLAFALVSIASTYGAFESHHELKLFARLRKGVMLAVLTVGLAFALMAAFRLGGYDPAQLADLTSQTKTETGPSWTAFSEQALQSALTQGRPVIIDFYADWCVACKELEQFTFPDPSVSKELQKFALLKVDATENFEGLEELKQRFMVVGLPTMLFLDQRGEPRSDLTLVGYEDATQFLERLKRAHGEKSLAR